VLRRHYIALFHNQLRDAQISMRKCTRASSGAILNSSSLYPTHTSWIHVWTFTKTWFWRWSLLVGYTGTASLEPCSPIVVQHQWCPTDGLCIVAPYTTNTHLPKLPVSSQRKIRRGYAWLLEEVSLSWCWKFWQMYVCIVEGATMHKQSGQGFWQQAWTCLPVLHYLSAYCILV